MSEVNRMLDTVRRTLESSQAYESYSERHNIRSATILTVTDAEIAASITGRIEDPVRDKVVVEIGGEIGLLSLYMGAVASRVYCIEANPVWAASFTHLLLEMKPKNVSYIFGAADQFVGSIKADVAVICTHSDVVGMKATGGQLAKEVIDVSGELIDANPQGFGPVARELRQFG
jgi:predicted RNA methylase